MKYFTLLVLILTSCSVTESHYIKDGGIKRTITGEVQYEGKNCIWVNGIKICNRKGTKLIGQTVTVEYVECKYQNEFIKICQQ